VILKIAHNRHSLILYIVKKEFDELVVDGNNYLTWVIDVEIKLNGTCLNHTIAQPEAGKDERT
jgi:hypothetical protein